MASRTFGGNSCASECVCRPVQSLRMCAVVAGAVLQIMQRSVLYSVGQMYLASTGVRIESVCSWRYSTPSRRVSCGCGAGSRCLLWRYHLRMSPYVSSGTGSLSSARSWLFRLRSECWLVCVARYVSPRAARSASSFRLRIRPSGSSGVCRIPTDKDRVLARLARPVEEAGRTGACCVVRKAEDRCS